MARRFRMDMRRTSLLVAAITLGIALLILWLGYRHDREVDLLISEGQLVQGRQLYREFGSCSGRNGCDPDLVHVAYDVDGTTYRTSMPADSSREREPLFDQALIEVPALGPQQPFQVIYLPADPEVSRVRADLRKSDVAVYGTAGMFGLIGLVAGWMGLFVLRRRGR